MRTFIHKIIEVRRKAREEKMLEWRRSHIAYCIKNSDIKIEDLIPIPDDEYDKIVRDLEEKMKSEIGDEPRYNAPQTSGPEQDAHTRQERFADEFVSALGIEKPHNFCPNGLPNIFAWREIVDSMRYRVRDAYYLKNRPCGKCGKDNTIFFCFRSSDESWRELCGREGYMLICPDCLTIIGFVHYIMN